ncbi:translation initiation factor eIF-2B subunit family protein [Poronia punctata]|nr:translation initiation factor eIF-2B subunit family protein [Poronia punctata]
MASSAGTEGITKRAVAGSFLFKIPNGDDKQAKVALFRRSSKVRTYQHKLAPCSGSVEKDDASPLATALREIGEETTLPPSSLDLLRVGKPYSFIDDSLRREWNINPFAFRLKDVSEGGKGEEGITLDWEHDGIEWFDPREVDGSDEFGGVPNLVTSLRRVWPEYDLGFEAGKVLTEGLQKLRDDHKHGASELAGMAVTTLRQLIVQMASSQPLDESWWYNVRMAAWHICQARPSMGAAITTAIIKALQALQDIRNSGMDGAGKTQRIIQALDRHQTQRNSMTDRIRDSFIEYLRSNISRHGITKDRVSVLTLSSSSTIATCLQHVVSTLGVTIDLRVLESRPLNEGVSLASRVLKKAEAGSDLHITLYSDASAALAAQGIDYVLLGADLISSTGDVSNKIGSLPAVLSARHVSPNAKVVILTDTGKIVGPASPVDRHSEEVDPSELSRSWKDVVEGADVLESGDSRVSVKNAYFERVPAEFIDIYVTEQGVWKGEQIQQQSDWIDRTVKQYFDDL